jgi:hypothetical protein
LNQVKVLHRPRLLSDNGPSYVSSELGKWLEDNGHGERMSASTRLRLALVGEGRPSDTLYAGLHLVYELPIGANTPTGAQHGSARAAMVPTPRRTGPRFHRPAKFQSMSTASAVTRLVPTMMGIVEVAALATSLARQRTVGVCQRAG